MKTLNNLIKDKLKSHIGLLCLIAAQLCICINIVANKYLIKSTPALLLLVLRFYIGSIVLYIYYYTKNPQASKLKEQFSNLNIKSKSSIIMQGLLGGFFFNLLMLSGLKLTSATMAGILSSLLPSLIIVFSYFILKETISKNELYSIVLATIGILFINISKFSGPGLSLHIFGDLLILLALFPEALYTIVAKKHPVDLCPITSTTLVNIINALAFSLTLFMFPADLSSLTKISGFDWFIITTLLASAGLLFFLLWGIGLKHSSTQQAGIVTAVVPAGSCILAVLFLHESIQMYELIGISMIITAIYIGTKNQATSRKKTKKDAIELDPINDELTV